MDDAAANLVTVVTPQAAPDDSFTGPEFASLYMKKREKNSVCSACGLEKVVSIDKLFAHPVLGVLVCETCFRFYHNGPFTKDEDGIDEQCRWCGQGGNLLMCDYCNNSFCNYCIKRNFSRHVFERIRDKPKWKCFVCNPKQLEEKVRECKKIVSLTEHNARKHETATNTQDLLLHSLDEGNKHLDDLIAPMEAHTKLPPPPSNHNNSVDADHTSKKVTPITILREREKYVIQKAVSGDEQTHSKPRKEWQSDPETKSSKRKQNPHRMENNMNLANVPERHNHTKKTDEPSQKVVDVAAKESEAPLETTSVDNDETAENMPNDLSKSPNFMLKTKNSEDLKLFKLQSPNPERDDSIIKHFENIPEPDQSIQSGSEHSKINPNSVPTCPITSSGADVGVRDAASTGDATDMATFFGLGLETKDTGETRALGLQTVRRRNVGRRTALTPEKKKQTLDYSNKMEEAKRHLNSYLQIVKDMASELCTNNNSGGMSIVAHSPSQYCRFKGLNALLSTVSKDSSRMLRAEHDIRLEKEQLGTFRDNAESDMSSSSSDNKNQLFSSRSRRKSKNFSDRFDTASEKERISTAAAVEYEIPAAQQPETLTTKTVDSIVVDELNISGVEKLSAAKGDSVSETDDPSPKSDEALKLDDLKLACDPVVMIEKLTDGKIAEMSQRREKEDSDSTVGSTGSRLDTDSSKNTKLGKNDSSSSDDDTGPNFSSVYPKQNKTSGNAKKTYVKGSAKSRKVQKYEEDSDFEIEGDYMTDSDSSKSSASEIEDFDFGGGIDDNEIAKKLLLQKMQEQEAETTDSDVEKLFDKHTEIKKDSSKKQWNTDVEEGKPFNKGQKNLHPLLRKRWRSKSDDEIEMSAKKEKTIEKKTETVKRKREENSAENAKTNISGALNSDPDLTTDSESNSPIRKRKKANANLSRKILDSDNSDSEDRGSVVLVVSEKEDQVDDNNNSGFEENSEDSDSDFTNVKRFTRKRRRRLTVNSKSEVEVELKKEDAENEPSTPRKGGRKNIRKILDDDEVSQSTQMASIEESRRRKCLEAEREAEEEREEVIVIDGDNNTEVKKTVTVGLILSKIPLVKVHSHIVKNLKPHQIEGVKFLWENLIEKVDVANVQKGNGCILAHCMGLGKTLQTIALLHSVLMTKHLPKLRTALILCPFGTVNNWVAEFKKWIPKIETDSDNKFKRLPVMDLNTARNDSDRSSRLETWRTRGGVMVIGYGLFRSILNDLKRHSSKYVEAFKDYLLSPGPDILVCDEGHILKNAMTRIATIVEKVLTKRRIILTGTPLQNNMMEYHCMVSIVKPKLLGTLKEFKNRFVNPIENGQHVDSTERDVKLMKKRAHVLHELLSGCVQRKDFSCLLEHIAPKREYTIKIRLSDLQIRLYEKYLTMHKSADTKMQKGLLFKDFQKLLVLVCHPRCLVMAKERQNLKENPRDDDEPAESDDEDTSSDDSVIMLSDDDAPSSQVPKPTTLEDIHALSGWKLRLFIKEKGGEKPQTRNRKKLVTLASKYLDENFCKTVEFAESLKAKSISQLKAMIAEHRGNTCGCTEKSDLIDLLKSLVLKETQADEEWYEKFMPAQEKLYLANEHGGKIMIMLEILQGAAKLGDKVVIFSQSLLTLDLIEDVLKAEMKAMAKGEKPATEPYSKWCRNKDYYRLDGSTPGNLRDLWISKFNDKGSPRGRLFLISTRAGGIGINLVGANRAIVFDASWNPTHDIQSIFRIYRFGQTKPCYIYRLVAQGTMEEKIYERQVVKRSLAYRVIDEQQVSRHFTAADIAELYKFNPAPKPDKNKRVPDGAPPDDALIASIIMSTDLIVSYHEPDSLLDHQVSEELTEAERRAAWEEYENQESSKTFASGLTSSVAKFLSSLELGMLFPLIRKGEETIGVLQKKIASIVSTPYNSLMTTIFMKNRSLSVEEVAQRAIRQRLEQHIMLRRLNALKKMCTEYTAEARRCYEIKFATPQNFGNPGPSQNNFPPYTRAPVNTPSYQRLSRPLVPGPRPIIPGVYPHSKPMRADLRPGPRLPPRPNFKPATGPRFFPRAGVQPSQQRPSMRQHRPPLFRPNGPMSSGAQFRSNFRIQTNANTRSAPGHPSAYSRFAVPQAHR